MTRIAVGIVQLQDSLSFSPGYRGVSHDQFKAFKSATGCETIGQGYDEHSKYLQSDTGFNQRSKSSLYTSKRMAKTSATIDNGTILLSVNKDDFENEL